MAGQANPTNSGPIDFKVVFSKPLASPGLLSSEVTLGGTAGATTVVVQGSGPTYTLVVTGMPTTPIDGTVTVYIAAGKVDDLAGNPNLASNTAAVVYDTTPATVTINAATTQKNPTNVGPINFTVVFSDPMTNFTGSDVTLTGTAGATTAFVTGSGTTYNVAVSGMTQTGTVTATIAAGVALDTAGNSNVASTSTGNDNTVTYDNVPPTVTVSVPSTQPSPTAVSPVNFTVSFSESVVDFTAADVSFAGSTAPGTLKATVTGSGTTYNVAVQGMAGSGSVDLSIPGGLVHDAAGNANIASPPSDVAAVVYDTQPTVTVNMAAGQANPTNVQPINFTAVFSAPVSGFTGQDVSFLPGTTAPGTLVATVTGSGTTYNIAVTGMTSFGNVSVTIPANVVHDAYGMYNRTSTSTNDVVAYSPPPSVTISDATAQANPTNAGPIHFTVTFSEAVQYFYAPADVSLSGTAGANKVVITETTGTGIVTGEVYDVAVSGMSQTGTVIATIPAGVAWITRVIPIRPRRRPPRWFTTSRRPRRRSAPRPRNLP